MRKGWKGFRSGKPPALDRKLLDMFGVCGVSIECAPPRFCPIKFLARVTNWCHIGWLAGSTSLDPNVVLIPLAKMGIPTFLELSVECCRRTDTPVLCHVR